MQTETKTTRLPLPGQRILRSVAAIWLCFAVYLLRQRSGIPFYSAIAALQCIQPSTRGMRKTAFKRLIGTLVGAFWGMAALLLELRVLRGGGLPEEAVHILLLGLFAGFTLYSTVLLGVREAAYFSTVVMLSITVNHIGDANPYLFVFNRVLDTTIGVLVAEFVNRLHLPRVRQTDTLFIADLNETLLGRGSALSPYAKVELNRLLDDGARFSIFTMQTQATVRELLEGVELRYPIITMDGAALYDMQRREYLKVVTLTDEQSRRVEELLRREGYPYFANTLMEHTTIMRFGEAENEAIRQLYEEKKRSPYRNFVRLDEAPCRNVIYFMILDRTERIEQAAALLQAQPWIGEYRLAHDSMKEHDGYACLKICSAAATRESMLRELERRMGTRRTVIFGTVPGRCDVLIENADRDGMVKELKRRFEKLDPAGWRNIFKI